MNREQRRRMSQNQIKPNDSQPMKTAEFYQGSVPPPAMLMEFGKVDANFPDRIVRMAEEAGNRQMKQLENQEKQIELEAKNRAAEIVASERLKTLDINARREDAKFRNLVTLIGLLAAMLVCAVLLYLSYMLLIADKTGSALGMASPIIGVALVGAIRILRK